MEFEEWYNTLPEEKRDTTHYDLRRAYNDYPEIMQHFGEEGAHAPTVGADGKFLKDKNHPTVILEILRHKFPWMFDMSKEEREFHYNNILGEDGNYYKYYRKYGFNLGKNW